MDLVPCSERDRILLALLLAVNAQNDASSGLEGAASDAERRRFLTSVEAGRGQCHDLRDRLVEHCQQHGC